MPNKANRSKAVLLILISERNPRNATLDACYRFEWGYDLIVRRERKKEERAGRGGEGRRNF